ncbi:unnamed protein product [Fusarium fujikuroi]|uniref:Uncharacterized protein n=1 Tax=Fusarium fujikuroi TaxID=5127 RepID=A0A9Q9UGL1_FUSFU|nr:uncharacterized protein FFM5_09764 [Fusarium fujikuroi]VTT74256.1 unnamed protein product [Fusarium fujikuroi]VTT81412.1 unnamed protein product [Fusarium fujikuroi]VZH94051.1 unnamed protein product [Fusarium fujikuroi]
MIPFYMELRLRILLKASSLLSHNFGSSQDKCFVAHSEYHSPMTTLSFYLDSPLVSPEASYLASTNAR